MSAITMITIGEALKKTRESKNITIAQAQKQTSIHSTVLIALEEGRCDEILTPTYVKSFLKKYTHYLGLNVRDIMDGYLALHSEDRPREIPMPAPVTNDKPNVSTINIPREKVLAGVMIVVGIAVLLLVVNAAFKFVASKIEKSQKTKTMRTDNARSVKAQAQSTGKKVRDRASSKKAVQLIPDSVALKVVLKTKAPVWVELKKDGEMFFKRVLPKGVAESVTANESVEFFAANGESIEVILNGRPLGSPPKGIVKNVEITRYGMKVK